MRDGAIQAPQPEVRGPRYQPLVVVLAALGSGIVADRYYPLPVGIWWFVAAVALISWFLFWRRRRDRIGCAFLVLAVAVGGGAWHHCQWYLFPDDDLGFSSRVVPRPACVDAVALRSPRRFKPPQADRPGDPRDGDRSKLEVAVTGVRNGAVWQTASGRARLVVDGELAGIRAGDRIRVFCQTAVPAPPLNPGEFDFRAHYRADRIRSVLRVEHPDCISVTQAANRPSITRTLDNLRSAGDRYLAEYLDPRRAGIASAVLLGIREEVTTDQNQAFMQTGTIHILSISGLHIGILASSLFFLLRGTFLRRIWIAAVVASVTMLYTLLTDAEPPAVRATILVLIVCGSSCLGRPGLGFNSLAAAGIVVLALNPADLFRVGPQLSFLCVALLSWFGRSTALDLHAEGPLERLVRLSRPWPVRVGRSLSRWIYSATFTGAMVWLFTLPLVTSRYHILSTVALGLNILLWLPMTASVWFGMALMVCGLACPPLAPHLGWCCDQTFRLLEWSVETARGLPGSYFWVSGPADWWLAGFYGMLTVCAAVPRLRPPRRWRVALFATWAAVGMIPGLLPREPKLQTTFVAVGHGVGVLLELPSGGALLYDAGRLQAPHSAARSISATLWSKGITRLDAVVLSHADADHFNAIPDLLEQFPIGVVFVSPVMFQKPDAALEMLQKSISEARAPIQEVYSGDRLQGGADCIIEVLHPPRRGVRGSDNANSIVLDVRFQERRILLGGDLEPPGLTDVLAEEPQKYDLILAPHHGSMRSDPPGLAKWSQPAWVVVSGGLSIDLRRTTAAYQSVGSQILHTARNGAIEVTIQNGGMAVRTFRKDPVDER